MIRDLIIESGFRFLAYHDTLGGSSAHVANPQNEVPGMWVLVGLLVLCVVAVIIFSKKNKKK